MALRRVPLRVVVPMLLMAIVAVLASLQYRWLGQVSQAERTRMHETMTARAEALAADLDHEVARIYVAFQLRQPELAALDAALARRYQLWRESTRYPNLVRDLYIARHDGTLERFDAEAMALQRIEWPKALEPVRVERQADPPPLPGNTSFAFRFPRAISTGPLAVSVMLPFDRPAAQPAPRPLTFPGVVLAVLDESVVRDSLLPALARDHLGDSLDEYRVAIVDAADPTDVVYRSEGDAPQLDPAEADVTVNALTVRASIAERVLATELRAATAFAAGLEASGGVTRVPEGARRDHLTLFIQQQPEALRPDGPHAPRITTMARAVTLAGGAWQVLLKHRAGSLEAAVQQVRRRNLLVSFGMLALLAASVGLVLVSARRAERLASQQMDFVATVSHELRTPLAVIRSAGQNLSAGVVHDTKRYGELIETEGRRLTEMIEQTLALAGLSGGRRPLAQHAVDAGEVARAVAASPETLAQAGDIAVELRVADDLPPVLADEMLLRRGVQNLVGNALKYGGAGGWVGLTVDAPRRGREVRITVSDRGPGLAADDLPHIFEPFYRGRGAIAAQVPGNGLGLHLVRRIAEAHGGRVTVRSTPGEGAAFTLHIPAGADPRPEPLPGEQPQRAMEPS